MNTIRTVRREDLPGLLNLYVHLNPDNASLPGNEHLQQVWQQILSDPKLHCFVAETNGTLTGTCLLVIVPNLTRSARPFGVIENVVIHRDYRRQGIGSQLMRHTLDGAWGGGCYKAMLLSGSRREEAHRFYEGLGFKRDSKVGFVAMPAALPKG
ncbi:MAG: GNAT family N-acetyltransferase [Janthinobacterium lividum]